MYHKRKIVNGSQRIQIIMTFIKNLYYIVKFILNKRQGSESTSVLLEHLKTYFHKVEFSVLLKSGIIQYAPPHTGNFAKQKTVQIHGFIYRQRIINRK